ncbi:MAG: hypothetical protein SF097_02475 [Acidobacteriota bacterium]|nr:hypothetical protein [Acidobacteriota bacterium]
MIETKAVSLNLKTCLWCWSPEQQEMLSVTVLRRFVRVWVSPLAMV